MLNHKLRTCLWFYRAIRKSIREKKICQKCCIFSHIVRSQKMQIFAKKQMQKYDKIQILMMSSYSKEFHKFFCCCYNTCGFRGIFILVMFREKVCEIRPKIFFFFCKSFCALETLVMIGHPNNIFKVVKTLRDFIFKD